MTKEKEQNTVSVYESIAKMNTMALKLLMKKMVHLHIQKKNWIVVISYHIKLDIVHLLINLVF
ncbi:Uncharacterised protein [Chlamydia trachomatis]|nr:Uncharacterised protein [Chlamydia trachomatis]